MTVCAWLLLQELEKRYYSNDAADAAKATKQAIADFNTLSAYFSQRGWTNLSLSSSSSESGRKLKQLTEADYRELDGQIDEVGLWLAVAVAVSPAAAQGPTVVTIGRVACA